MLSRAKAVLDRCYSESAEEDKRHLHAMRAAEEAAADAPRHHPRNPRFVAAPMSVCGARIRRCCSASLTAVAQVCHMLPDAVPWPDTPCTGPPGSPQWQARPLSPPSPLIPASSLPLLTHPPWRAASQPQRLAVPARRYCASVSACTAFAAVRHAAELIVLGAGPWAAARLFRAPPSERRAAPASLCAPAYPCLHPRLQPCRRPPLRLRRRCCRT